MKKIILLISLLFSFNLSAKTLHSASFDEKIQIAGKDLVLNGLGVRLATLFKVKVYVAGLYLEQKLNSWDAIKADSGVKKIRLSFLMGVSKDKLTKAWSEGYRNNLSTDEYESIKDSVGKLNLMMKSMKKKQVMEFIANTDTLEVHIKGSKAGEIKNAAFTKVFLSVFLGPKPPNEELRNGLLGK